MSMPSEYDDDLLDRALDMFVQACIFFEQGSELLSNGSVILEKLQRERYVRQAQERPMAPVTPISGGHHWLKRRGRSADERAEAGGCHEDAFVD